MNASSPDSLSPVGPTVPSHKAMEQAATWFSLLQSGEATETDRTAWNHWLAASEENRAAWHFVERVSQRFQPLKTSQSPRLAVDTLQYASDRQARRRIMLGLACIAGVGGVLGWSAWQYSGTAGVLARWGADHRTGTGERREITLADGTQVWLGSATAFDLNYGADLRRLRLRAGEIFIQTASDSARPFVVDTVQGRMRALGTRFNVRLDSDGSTQLAVYQGAVQISLARRAETAVVGAGKQLRFTAEALQTPAPADPAREAWSRGILLAQDMPLDQFIQELSRYSHGHMAVSPQVARLSVLGSYPLDDVNGTLAMLQQTLPVRVHRPLPWWTSIEPRSD